MKCAARFSEVTQVWRAQHPEIKFLNWPEYMDDIYPLNGVWCNVENRVEEDVDDPEAIYESWNDSKEDLDNFNVTYKEIKQNVQKVVYNHGN